jgi:UTP--glucose-1-phosphate uridylyltransferase
LLVITKGVILAAGLGTRLYPLTRALPKEMLPLGRKPAIQLVAEELVAAGLQEILMVVGPHKSLIEDHFYALTAPSPATCGPAAGVELVAQARFFSVRQRAPRGTGDAVRYAEGFVNAQSFVVAFGDAVLRCPQRPTLLERMLQLHDRRAPSAVVAVRRVPRERLQLYGVVRPAAQAPAGEAFRISDLVEKPPPDQAPSAYALAARYLFSPVIFSFLAHTPPSADGEVQLTAAIRAMLRAGHEVWAVPVLDTETRYDVGNFADYAQAFVDFALADAELGAQLRQYLADLVHKPLA